MKGLILAGGLGKRFRPLSYSGPKQLIPIANKPVLHYIIEYFHGAGIKELGIVVGYTPERINAIKNSCGDGSKWDMKITYIEQDAPRGIAHAVYICRKFVNNEKFVVFLGDNLLKDGITPIVEEFSRSDASSFILVTKVDNPSSYGVAELNKDNEIISIEEKPENPKSKDVIVGVYCFSPDFFPIIEKIKPSARGELEITHAIEKLVNDPHKKVIAKRLTGWWDDTGTFDAAINVNNIILMDLKGYNYGTLEDDVKIIGEVGIGNNTVIKTGSVIRGPVIIGNNCVIGVKSYIGPYTSIGNNVKIIGGEIEASMVLNNCYLNYRERIIESIIGENSIVEVNPKELPRGHRFILGDFSRIVNTE